MVSVLCMMVALYYSNKNARLAFVTNEKLISDLCTERERSHVAMCCTRVAFSMAGQGMLSEVARCRVHAEASNASIATMAVRFENAGGGTASPGVRGADCCCCP